MAVIALEGMEFRAKHGYYKEEQILGGDFVVDVYMTTKITKAAVGDDLEKTINYETVYLICKVAMREPCKLLETVAEKIVLGIKHQFGYISELIVRVSKKNPPLGGIVKNAYVEVNGDFTKKCGRCSRPMICYEDRSCWCMGTQVFKRTLEQVKGEYGNQCLCRQCLEFFAA